MNRAEAGSGRAQETRARDWESFWQSRSRPTRISWAKKRITAVLEEYLKPGLWILDAGSGSGFFSAYFLACKCRVAALDYSEKALALTRDRTNGKAQAYLHQDLRDPEWATAFSGRFDLVFSDGLLEHFGALEQGLILKHLKTVIRPGGLVASFVPNRYSWWRLVRPLVMRNIHEEPFTLLNLRALYRAQDLTIVQDGGLNVLPMGLSPEARLGDRLGMLVYALGR